MPETGASRNQGNSSKARKTSRSPKNSQKPWREMLATSASVISRADLCPDLFPVSAFFGLAGGQALLQDLALPLRKREAVGIAETGPDSVGDLQPFGFRKLQGLPLDLCLRHDVRIT